MFKKYLNECRSWVETLFDDGFIAGLLDIKLDVVDLVMGGLKHWWFGWLAWFHKICVNLYGFIRVLIDLYWFVINFLWFLRIHMEDM